MPPAALGVPAADLRQLSHRWRSQRKTNGCRGVAFAPCPFEEPKSSTFKAALALACQGAAAFIARSFMPDEVPHRCTAVDAPRGCTMRLNEIKIPQNGLWRKEGPGL